MLTAVIGPESSGKTTLAKQRAFEEKALYVPEYGRIYLEKLNRPYTREDVEIIARVQIGIIQSIFSQNSGISAPLRGAEGLSHSLSVYFDTDLIMMRVWFEVRYGCCPDWLLQAIEDYPMDYYILCAPDIPWVADPTRENGSDSVRQQLFDCYLSLVRQTHIPYEIFHHTV